MKRTLLVLAGIAVLLITALQVRGRAEARPTLSPVQATRPTVSAEGRFVTYPGAEVTIGTDVAGTIDRLAEEKQAVRRGEVVAVIRAEDTRAALTQARARVGEADADIRLYETERDRARSLWQSEVGSKQIFERAERDLDAARARRASAVADVERLEATLNKTIIKSPIDGVVLARFIQPGESAVAGNKVLQIADLSRTRVEAEVDEFDAGRVHLGATAYVTAEGYDKRWRGVVEEIPDSVTDRRLRPLDTGKPIDTRVLIVKVALKEPTPLKLAQRVEIEFESR